MIWSQIVEGFKKPINPLSPEMREHTHKRCIECEKMLPLDNFYARQDTGRLVGRCKPCYKAQKQRYKRSLK